MQKSTTKISIFLVSILSCLVLFSCTDPNNVPIDAAPSKEELYKSIIGKWVFEESDNGNSYPNLLITAESIRYIYDNSTYTDYICICNFEDISTIKDMKQANENSYNTSSYVNAKEQLPEILKLYPKYSDYDLCYYYTPNPDSSKMIERFRTFKLEEGKLFVLFADFSNYQNIWEYHENTYKLEKNSSSTDNNNPETSITESDLISSYTISEANGSTFTFSSDGTWTYSYNSSTTNGTWSVSDGELIITYTLGGYSSSAVFTVSVSGDTYTLTGKSGDYTTIISSAFKITNQEALENGVVTLVKQ